MESFLLNFKDPRIKKKKWKISGYTQKKLFKSYERISTNFKNIL